MNAAPLELTAPNAGRRSVRLKSLAELKQSAPAPAQAYALPAPSEPLRSQQDQLSGALGLVDGALLTIRTLQERCSELETLARSLLEQTKHDVKELKEEIESCKQRTERSEARAMELERRLIEAEQAAQQRIAESEQIVRKSEARAEASERRLVEAEDRAREADSLAADCIGDVSVFCEAVSMRLGFVCEPPQAEEHSRPARRA